MRDLRLVAGTALFLAACIAPARPRGVAEGARDPLVAADSAAAAPAFARDLGGGVTIRRLAPGVWMHTTRGTFAGVAGIASNGLIIESGNESLLIDTAWDDAQTDTILRWASRTLPHPVRRAIITHAHADRLGGLGALGRAGIAAFSAPLTRERALAADSVHPPHAPIALPPLRAEGGAMEIGDVALLYPGGGHARDNIVVWIPASRVLFGGCFVRALAATSLGFTGDADVDAWPASLRRVRAAFPGVRAVVPGHGEPGDASLLEHTAELLRRRVPTGG
jgi:glyoxylase-like metal-dependent hydrolase (beta-lactamase superfamily II)